jgi:trans-aconitate methyltransferase
MSDIFEDSDYSNNSKTQSKQGKLLLEKIQKYQPKRVDKILDIGCGTGELSEEVSKLYSDSHMIAIDSSQSQIKNCKNVNNIDLRVSKFPDYSLEKNTFDIIFSNAAMHWIDEQEEAYKLISQLLRKEGIVCIHQGHIGCYKELRNIARDIISKNYDVDISSWEYPINYHNRKTLKNLLKDKDLRILDIQVKESNLPDSIFKDYSEAGLNNFNKLLPENKREEFSNQFLKKANSELNPEDISSKRLYFVLEKKINKL